MSSGILRDQFTSPCPCPQTTKSLKIVEDSAKRLLLSVTATMHEVMVKNGFFTGIIFGIIFVHISLANKLLSLSDTQDAPGPI